MNCSQQAMRVSYTPSTAMVPGTCGELFQGKIAGEAIKVNCPIDLYSSVSMRWKDKQGLKIRYLKNNNSSVIPGEHLDKSFNLVQRVAENFATQHRLHLSHEICIDNTIPQGKGMAPRNADVVAALLAISRTFDVPISTEALSTLFSAYEPCHGLHNAGITCLNHLNGKINLSLPTPENLRVIIVDCGGEEETYGYNERLADEIYGMYEPSMQWAFELLKRGLSVKDNRLIAKAATVSAELRQKILHKPQFKDLLTLAKSYGALGVNCAHNGTALGVLYQQDPKSGEKIHLAIDKFFNHDVSIIGDFGIVGGGCKNNQY